MPLAITPRKFNVDDPEAAKYLEDNGYVILLLVLYEYAKNISYVVFSKAANAEQVEEAIKLFWDHVEKFTVANRSDVSSWSNDNWVGDLSNGIVSDIL